MVGLLLVQETLLYSYIDNKNTVSAVKYVDIVKHTNYPVRLTFHSTVDGKCDRRAV